MASSLSLTTPLATPAMRQLLWRLLVVAVVYAVAARVGLLAAVVGSTVTLLWAPSGIALAAVLCWGWPMAAGVLLGALVANVSTGLPVSAAWCVGLGNMLEAVAGAWLLQRWARFDTQLATLRDVLALIGLAAFGSTMVSATIGTATLMAIGTVAQAAAPTVWLIWWLGDMMGVLVVTPLLLLARQPVQPMGGRRVAESALLAVGLIAVSSAIFHAQAQTIGGAYATSLAVFPFMIWGALRFEQRGAALVTLLIALLAVWGTALGRGPFIGGPPEDSLLRWCAFGIVTAVTGLLLAASVSTQRRAAAALEQSHRDLERRVDERTAALAEAGRQLQHEMDEGRRLEVALIRVSEDQQRAVGRELHDGLGQLLTSLSLICGALHLRLQTTDPAGAATAARLADLIQQATATTRALARGLHPVALEFGGLPAALHALTDQTRATPGLECSLRMDGLTAVADPMVALNLFRVAQEAVANAVKYSQARHIHIALQRADGLLQLSVQDDGAGLPQMSADPASATGIGMASMRFRASLLGGQLQIDTRPGAGTRITVTYPDSEAQHAS